MYHCIALYDCVSNDPKVLNFKKGEELYYKNNPNIKGWVEGKNLNGICGLIPDTYINKI